jgi:BlaI family penicillinase repressor
MEEVKLPDSEVKVMNYIWSEGKATAKAISEYMIKHYEWKKNTTYTVLNNLINKGILKREEPDFLCTPMISREHIGKTETKSLLKKFYNGSFSDLFSAFLNDPHMSQEELDEIKAMIENSK